MVDQPVSEAANSPATVAGHACALGAILGTLIGWLPAIATAFAIIWYAFAIWETKTVQNWRQQMAEKRRRRRRRE